MRLSSDRVRLLDQLAALEIGGLKALESLRNLRLHLELFRGRMYTEKMRVKDDRDGANGLTEQLRRFT